MSPRRRLAALALAVVATTSVSACGTSFNAQTNQQYQAAVGANLRSGALHLYNALLVENDDKTFTLSAAVLAPDAAQQITAVDVSNLAGEAAKASLSAPIRVPENRLVTVGTKAEILVTGTALKSGDYARVTVTAAPGGQVELDVPIVDRDMASYDSVATARPTESPTPATPTESVVPTS